MNKKQWLGLGLVTVAAIGLAACGNRASKKDSANSESKTDLKAAIVTDTGGVEFLEPLLLLEILLQPVLEQFLLH